MRAAAAERRYRDMVRNLEAVSTGHTDRGARIVDAAG